MNSESQESKKTWWAPFHIGLILEGHHRSRMRGAIWLFLYLIAHADRETGQLLRKYATIAKDMNTSHKTVQRWMNILRSGDYIETRRLIYGFHIQITKWRPALKKKKASQNDRSWIERVDIPYAETGHFENSDRTYLDNHPPNRGTPSHQYKRDFATQSLDSVQSKDSIKESTKHIHSAFEEDWKNYVRPGGNKKNAWRAYLATVGKDLKTQRPRFVKKMKDYAASIHDPHYYKHGETFFREWQNLVIARPPQRSNRVAY